MLNMIFLVSLFFITKLVSCYSVSLTLNFSDIYIRTHAHIHTHTHMQTQPPTPHRAIVHMNRGKHLLEFQFLLQAVPAEKRGCIGNYPLLHLAVTIEVRSCPVSMVQVCCPTRTAQCTFPHIRINRTLEIRFPPSLRNVILLYFNAPLCFIVGSINKTQSPGARINFAINNSTRRAFSLPVEVRIVLVFFQMLPSLVKSDLNLHIILLQVVKVRRPTLFQCLEVAVLRVHLVCKYNRYRNVASNLFIQKIHLV